MLTTTVVKYMVMLLLVALATVNAEDCEIIKVSEATTHVCCPCAKTTMNSCVSTLESTCSRFGFEPGSAKCDKGQWGCYYQVPLLIDISKISYDKFGEPSLEFKKDRIDDLLGPRA